MKTMGTMKLELTKAEKRAFAIVDEILDTIQSCGEEYQAMSVKNGDVVDFSEIARVRGILDCFANGGDYDITKTTEPKCEDACDCGCCEECCEDWENDYYEELVKECVKELFGRFC